MSVNINMNVLTASFREDSIEHMAAFEQALLHLEKSPGDMEAIHTSFRAVHTIKGSGAVFKYDELTRFAHGFENLLDLLRDGDLKISPEIIQLLFRAHDHIQLLLAYYAEPEPSHPLPELKDISNALLLRVSQLTQEKDVPALMPACFRLATRRGLFQAGMNLENAVRYLVRHSDVKTVRLDTTTLPDLRLFNPAEAYLALEVTFASSVSAEQAEAALHEAFEFLGPELEIAPIHKGGATPAQTAEETTQNASSKPTTRTKVASSIRVDSAKLDELVNLVGELVMKNGNVHQIAYAMQIKDILKPLSDVSRIVENVRELAMNLRMIPIGGIFRKMERVVHDLTGTSGKQIRILYSGEDTELDKNVIEKLSDPLMHIIRNSADHGIESPETRLKAGKDPQGTIQLTGYHEGGAVVVEIKDDGRGLNLAQIRERAISMGAASAEREYSASEIQNFIFLPGFSTAENVSEISGRGVGMDVVRRNIDALRGSIYLTSSEGQGMTIRITLPLTLAIISGFLVRSGRQKFIIPLDAVKECVDFARPEGEDSPHRHHFFDLRGSLLPYIRLSSVFSLEQTDNERESLVVAEQGGRRIGILIDEPLGEHQTVIKPLTGFLSGIKGVGGATILSTGDMALVVDLYGLMALLDADREFREIKK